MPNKTPYIKRRNACEDPVMAGYSLLQDYDTNDLKEIMVCSSETIVRNKLNPESERNVQTLIEAVALSVALNDDRQLAAWAAKRGKALVSLPTDCICEEELADQLLLVSEVIGCLHTEIRNARADGVIDAKERQAIRAAALNAVRTVLELDESIGSQVRKLPVQNNK
ncbi:phage regulatory CII family protein [Bowmanella denitrificans]|uniref:phage regulatory CII family protein n=1 Tax=Bowmanella denitrificans TaxID=366582 RepID=UPI000C9B057F|nr:phage regulatory CII family protein [Bowmanella denitrificans]